MYDSKKDKFILDENGNRQLKSSYYDTCFGVLWVQDYTNENEYAFQGDENLIIKDCDLYGGTFYRLSYVQFKTSAIRSGGDYSTTKATGETKGLITVEKAENNDATYYEPGVGSIPGGISAEEAEEKFALAYEHNATGGHAWPDVSWFCYNQSWENNETESNFDAYSYLSTNEYMSSTTSNHNSTFPTADSTKNVKEIIIDSEYYVVNVSHQLAYTPARAEGEYSEMPSTVWKSVVTVDNRLPFYRTFSPTTWTPSSNDEINTAGVYFSKNNLGATGVLLQLAPGKSSRVCSTIQYEPKRIFWINDEENPSRYKINNNKELEDENVKNSGSSTICIVVKRKEEEEKPPVITVEAGEGHFASSTELIIEPSKNGNDIRIRHDLFAESDNVKYKEVILSTDNSKLLADFDHWMYFKGSISSSDQQEQVNAELEEQKSSYKFVHVSAMPSSLLGEDEKIPDDVYPEICTDKITTSQAVYGNASVRNSIDGLPLNSRFCYQKDPEATDEEDEASRKTQIYGIDTVTIPLSKGSTMKVCQKTEFEPLTVSFEATTHHFRIVGNVVYFYWEYAEKERSGKGSSEACVTVTRPNIPPVTGNPKSGNIDTPFLYTGEKDGGVSWNVSTVAYNTRRMISWEATNFLVPVTQDGGSNTVGSIKNYPTEKPTDNNCQYYQNKLKHETFRILYPQYKTCEVVDSRYNINIYDNDALIDTKYEPSRYPGILHYDQGGEIIVPDTVGAKYCNSFGYQWKYYYAYINDDQVKWNEDTSNSPYWTHYDAACRTIVKKPSTSVWNGGVFSDRDITTSVASRYYNAYPSGPLVFSKNGLSDPDASFGSWTEFLAPVDGIVKGFGSGSALSTGSNEINKLLKWSTLTIANIEEPIGRSQISYNSIFKSRLDDYLFNNSNVEKVSPTEVIGNKNITSTKVVVVNGDLDIYDDIIVANSAYSSIYDLPQVIIYASGNINITSNVTRIDAWLVSGRTVNTCSEYEPANNVDGAGTQARVAVNTHPQNVTCDNQLTINGPIIANGIQLNRTAGADPRTYKDGDIDIKSTVPSANDRAISAEVFNLSADTYLWAYAQAGRYASSYTEAYTRELPPRY